MSSDNDDSNSLKDPRFMVIATIFVLYGAFIISVMLFSGSSFWTALWKLCKDCLRRGFGVESGIDGGRGRGEEGDADRGVEEGTHYQLLSERSKRRLDTLRQLAIERRLVNYSLKLRKDNVILQGQQKMNLDIMISNEEGDSTTSSNTTSTISDIEEGFCTSSDETGETEAQVVRECDVDSGKDENVEGDYDNDKDLSFTHVLLPYPGVGLLDGLCIEASSSDEDTSDNSNNNDNNEVSRGESEKMKKGKWPFAWVHFAKRKEEDDDEHNNNNNIDDDTEIAIQQETSKHKRSRRQVPIFCSICLSEFDLHQHICWSSNSACTHVFHSDCMIQWLVTLGRKHSTMKRFTLNPTERQLLGHYELQCPCCRQEFIKSAFIEKGLCEGGRSNSV